MLSGGSTKQSLMGSVAPVQWRVNERLEILKSSADMKFKMGFELKPNREVWIEYPGPAGEAGGLREDDVVISINGVPPRNNDHAVKLMWEAPVGSVSMVVSRLCETR